MLSPRWRKVLRDVWLHKSRTSLVALAICVGIVGAGSVLNAWTLLRRVTRGEFSASNPASATLRTDSIDAALLVRVRAVPGVGFAEARRTVTASVQTSNGPRTALLFALENPVANSIGIIKKTDGVWPPSDAGAVIEHSSVEFAGIAVGDPLTIQVGTRAPISIPITGIARDVGLAPGWMEHVVYLFVTPATLARLGAPASLTELQVVARDRTLDRAQVRTLAVEVKDVIERTGRTVSDVNVPVPGRHIHAAQIDSLLFTQGAFGLLALVLSGVLVVNLVSAMLTGQVREIGVMKAIGARGGQLAAMYLGTALILGLIACAVALPVAAVLGRLYAEFTADILNFDVSGFAIPAWSMWIQLAVGTLLPVIAAAFPVSRGARIPVSDALRDYGLGSRGGLHGGAGDDPRRGELLARITRRLGVGEVTRPLLLSIRNTFRRRQRMLLTLITLAAGGAVFLGALNLRASIVGSIDLVFASQRYDLTLRLARAHRADSVTAAIAALQDVEGVEGWTSARAAFVRPDGLISPGFPLIAPPVRSKLLVVKPEIGRWLTHWPGGDNEIVVNRSMAADDPTLAPGAVVTLIIGGKPTRWVVVGVADTGPSPIAYTTRETLAPLLGGRSDDVNGVVVATALEDASAQLALMRRVRRALGDAGFEVSSGQIMRQQRAVVEDHLLMVAGFLGNMSLLMIVVGGLGLASTMSLAVLERTREIGVLRAIGARHGSILAMVQIEGLVIAVLSWALALPLSLPMSVALSRAFGSIMLKTPVHLLPNPAGMLRWLVVVLVVSLVSCAWPALRAMRIPTSRALAFE